VLWDGEREWGSIIPLLAGGGITVSEGKFRLVRIRSKVSSTGEVADSVSFLTGYPLHGRLPGRPGLGGYWGVSLAPLSELLRYCDC